MYIKLKKVVVIFIFLFSIIVMLSIQNYSLKKDFYNILVVGQEDDLTEDSLVKVIWNNLASINTEQDYLKNNKLNYKYLEVSTDEILEASIDENIQTEDLVIIVGDNYNSSILNVLDKYEDIKFLLIENSLDISQENVYKININKGDLIKEVSKYLSSEIERLRSDKIIDKDEGIVLAVFSDDEEASRYFKEKLDSSDITFFDFEEDEMGSKDFLEMYNQQREAYIINLSLSGQNSFIKKLVEIQKDNIYTYYEDLDEKKPVEYSSDKDNELRYIPMHYIGLFAGDKEIGSYDNILESPVVEENIITFDFSLDYEKYLKDIIDERSNKKNYELNIGDDGLKFDII